MTAAPLPLHVRQARAFLQQNGVHSGHVSPRKFAAASHELKKSFRDTLRYLSLLVSGGSGKGPSPITTANKDSLDPIRALGHQTPSEAMAYDAARGEDD